MKASTAKPESGPGSGRIPFWVLGISLGLTVAAWALARFLVLARDDDRFKSVVSETHLHIQDEMDNQLRLVKALGAFVSTAHNVNPTSFRAFLRKQGWNVAMAKDGYLGYSVRVSVQEIPKLKAWAKSVGITPFKVTRTAGADYADAVLFVDPDKHLGPMGFNMSTDPDRRLPMRQAAETGEIVASGRIYLNDDKDHRRPAVLILVPEYGPAPGGVGKMKPSGFAFSALRLKQVLSSPPYSDFAKECSIDIYDPDAKPGEGLLYRSDQSSISKDYVPQFTVKENTGLENMPWKWRILYASTPFFALNSGEPLLPWIFAGGFLISFILFYISLNQTKTQREAETYAAEIERRATAQTFLGEASSVLAASLDYSETLASVARLAVPSFADWCAVDMLQNDGRILRLAVAHQNSILEEFADRILAGDTDERGPDYGVLKVIRTGQPAHLPVVTAEALDSVGLSEEQKKLFQSIPVQSAMIAPMNARQRTLGAMTFITAQSGHQYGKEDLQLAIEIAERAAIAVDNARLYQSAQQEIGERTRAEDQVRLLNESLERLVEDRTRELKVANEELEAFCYSVSHDLRAPLRSVDGFSKALLEDFGDSLSDEAVDYLHRVRAATKRMDELITALLNLSRLSRAEIFPEVIDFTAVAEAVRLEVDPAGMAQFEIEAGMTMEADARMIHVVMDNLVSNAVKFSSKVKSPCVSIGKRDGAFFVQDNGAGFNPEYSNKLFQPFERLHTLREFPGSGIGLATVARIIRRHGGTIWAESEVGKGATFYFWMPSGSPPSLKTNDPTS